MTLLTGTANRPMQGISVEECLQQSGVGAVYNALERLSKGKRFRDGGSKRDNENIWVLMPEQGSDKRIDPSSTEALHLANVRYVVLPPSLRSTGQFCHQVDFRFDPSLGFDSCFSIEHSVENPEIIQKLQRRDYKTDAFPIQNFGMNSMAQIGPALESVVANSVLCARDKALFTLTLNSDDQQNSLAHLSQGGMTSQEFDRFFPK
jgi:hypothetical protein